MTAIENVRPMAGRIHPATNHVLAARLAHGNILGHPDIRMHKLPIGRHPSAVLPGGGHEIGIDHKGGKAKSGTFGVGAVDDVLFDCQQFEFLRSRQDPRQQNTVAAQTTIVESMKFSS